MLEDPGEALKRADSGFRMLCGKFSATAMAGAYIGVYENVAT